MFQKCQDKEALDLSKTIDVEAVSIPKTAPSPFMISKPLLQYNI